MKKILILLVAAALGAQAVYAADNGVPGAFVDIGLARPSGMAGAYVAVADDASAVFYNPAAIATSEYADTTFMYAKQKWMIPYNYFAFVYPFTGLRGAGFGLIISGDDLMSEQTFILSYSENMDWILQIIKGIYIGTSLKLHFASYGNNVEDPSQGISGGAGGFGMDFGLLYQYNSNLRIGIMIRDGFSWINWSADYRDGVNNEGVPLTSDIGIEYNFRNFTFAADLEDLGKLQVGTEIRVFDYVDFRAGIAQFLDLEGFKEYSLGLGIGHFEFGVKKELSMNFDFSYTFERIDSSMKIQTSFKFK